MPLSLSLPSAILRLGRPFLDQSPSSSLFLLPLLALPPILSFVCVLAARRALAASTRTDKEGVKDSDASPIGSKKNDKSKVANPLNLVFLVALQCFPIIAGSASGVLLLAAATACPNGSLASLVLAVGALACIPLVLAFGGLYAAQGPSHKARTHRGPDAAPTMGDASHCAPTMLPSADTSSMNHTGLNHISHSIIDGDATGGAAPIAMTNRNDTEMHKTPKTHSAASFPSAGFTFPSQSQAQQTAGCALATATGAHGRLSATPNETDDGLLKNLKANKNTLHRSTASEPHALSNPTHALSAHQPHLSTGAPLASLHPPLLPNISPGASITSLAGLARPESQSTIVSTSPAPTVTPPRPSSLSVSADYLALEEEFVRLLLSSAAKAVKQTEAEQHPSTEIPLQPWPKEWPVYWEGAGLGAW